MRVILPLVLLSLLMGARSGGPPPKGPTSTIEVEVTELRSDKGEVEIMLFNQKDGYPTDPSKALLRQRMKINQNKSAGQFSNLPYGIYAIAGYHDENGDGTLNFNFLHIPKEGVCASNDAKGHMGPPSFEDAQFSLNGALVKISMKMSY